MKVSMIRSAFIFLIAVLWTTLTTAQQTTVLDANSYWRCLFLSSSPLVRVGNELKVIYPHKAEIASLPQNWFSPEFDDLAWVRLTGPFFPGSGHAYTDESRGKGFVGFEGSSADFALICLRGYFEITDLTKVENLQLNLAWRGGVVIYLNGQEVARHNLPAGQLTSSSLADDYPLEAYVREDGKQIRWGWNDPQNNKERLEKRVRKAENIPLPKNLLRKGMNVLAIQIHRTAYNEVALSDTKKSFFGDDNRNAWTTVGLVDLALSGNGSGLTDGTTRPKGVVIWNANPMQAIYDVDQGDNGATVKPLRLAGTRGGAFSGQIVVSSDAPIKGLNATVSPLRSIKGSSTISASAMQVRYAQPGFPEMGNEGRFRYGLRNVRRFDGLAESPPEEILQVEKPRERGAQQDPGGAVQPVWLTVEIPSETKAGDYTGELLLTVEGKKHIVPVELSVADWQMPSPQNYKTVVDFIQSPDSVALQYNVQPWSEQHYELLGKSFKQIAKLGGCTLYVPLICRTHFGNSESMVRWVKRADGGYDPDFSIVERYIDVAMDAGIKPRVVVLDVVEWYVGPKGDFGRGEQDPTKWQPPFVTEYDPQTKTCHEITAPGFVTPAAKDFWKPVMDGLRVRLEKRGLPDTMMLGVKTDMSWVPKEIAQFFKDVAPGVPWVDQGHGPDTKILDVPVGFATCVWTARKAVDPSIKRTYGWQNPWMLVYFHRDLVPSWPLTEFRLTTERVIGGNQRGIGRLGVDFWPALEDSRGKKVIIAGRYPEGRAAQLSVKLAFLAPGPEGALSTVRLEMMREGIQECEARIFLESVVLDDGQRTKLGEGLAQRCQTLLDERTRALLYEGPVKGHHEFIGSGWQARSKALYEMAAEVKAAIKK